MTYIYSIINAAYLYEYSAFSQLCLFGLTNYFMYKVIQQQLSCENYLCRLTKACVQPLVKLHKIRQQQSSSLKPRPLLCKLGQQVEVVTLGMALDVLRAQDTVCEVLLRREVWVAQPQMSAIGITMTLQLSHADVDEGEGHFT